MTDTRERWVLCGGVSHPKAPGDAIRLFAAGREKNIAVGIEGISSALTGKLSGVFRDLILIASYVLAADSAVKRGDTSDVDLNRRWRRLFHFVIGVESPSFWNASAVRELLAETLQVLSDDDYTFDFRPARARVPEQLSFFQGDGRPMVDWDHIDDVALFSGGLDALCGAAKLVFEEKQHVILVSHRSATKTWKIQRSLVKGIRERWNGQGPEHVAIEVTKLDRTLRVEQSQRSRSFLFASLAGAVAHLVGRDRVLLFENGIIALNLPISPQLIGATATRTAHPNVLHGFSKILETVSGHALSIQNPFSLYTRAEALRHLTGAGLEDLVAETVSCTRVSTRQAERPHCGRCSQCVDRRFGVLAAGLGDHDPEARYELGLESGDWQNEDHRLLILAYIAATDFYADTASVDDFLAHCGEVTRALPSLARQLKVNIDRAAQQVHELHRRHGKEVDRVLSDIFSRCAKAIRTGRQAATSLPMILFAASVRTEDGEVPRQPIEAAAPPSQTTENSLAADPKSPEYVFRREGDVWAFRFRGAKGFAMKPKRGFEYIRALLDRKGEYLTALKLIEICGTHPPPTYPAASVDGADEEVSSPDGHVTISSRPRETAMGIDQRAIDDLKKRRSELLGERREAREMCDTASVANFDKEITWIRRYLSRETRRGGRPRSETPEQKRSRKAVSNAIDRAIKEIGRHDESMAKHFNDEIDTGFFLRYHESGVPWKTS